MKQALKQTFAQFAKICSIALLLHRGGVLGLGVSIDGRSPQIDLSLQAVEHTKHLLDGNTSEQADDRQLTLRGRRRLVVLFYFVYNPDAIAKGAGDPRFDTLMGVGKLLKDHGHTVLAGSQWRAREKVKKSFEWLEFKSLGRHGKPDLIVTWVNYLHDCADTQKLNFPLITNFLKDKTIPRLVYENGMMKDTVTVDPQGQLADSYYVSSLNDAVQRNFDDKPCSEFIQHLQENDQSKRPQTLIDDIPSDISGRFVFVPTQKFEDVSVEQFSSITYPELLNKVTDFCKAHDLPLVIKIHPHLIGTSEETEQMALIGKLRNNYSNVYVSADSINDLLKKAFFTVTINGGTLMDNFVTNTPVLELAPSLWYRTDAVVYETDIEQGLSRMLQEASPWSEDRKLRQRQNVCWYRRMSLSTKKTPAENLEVLQQHLDAIQPQPLKI